jgi:hypothetical protein
MMKKLLYISFLVLASHFGFGQGVGNGNGAFVTVGAGTHFVVTGSGKLINTGASVINNSGTITVADEIKNLGTAIIDNDGTINVAGDWTNSSTVTASASSTVGFVGGAAQAVTSGTSSPFGNVIVNNTSTGLTLADEMTVATSVTFTDGIVTTGATNVSTNILTFDTGATVASASDASHVNGYMAKNTTSTAKFTFPSGDGTLLRAFSVTPSSTGATTYTMAYNTDAPANRVVDGSGLDHVSNQEYWDFARSGASPADAVIETTWLATAGVLDYTTLEFAHFDGTTDWDMVLATPVGTNATGTLTSGAPVTAFGPFTIGTTTNVNALPITLISFTGKKVDRNNELYWSTATEKNNDYFTIEKTEDGEYFEVVGMENGAVNSLVPLFYSMTDYNVKNSINYYRLKQTDFDGKSIFSKLISIDNRVSNTTKEVSYVTNILGQEISPNYRGLIIIRYTDGSSMKIIQ